MRVIIADMRYAGKSGFVIQINRFCFSRVNHPITQIIVDYKRLLGSTLYANVAFLCVNAVVLACYLMVQLLLDVFIMQLVQNAFLIHFDVLSAFSALLKLLCHALYCGAAGPL